MLAWVLIVGAWLGILLLILHDATEQQGSSPVSTGLRLAGLHILRGLKSLFKLLINLRSFRRTRIAGETEKASVAPPVSMDSKAVPTSSPQSADGALTTIERSSAKAAKNKWWSKDRRAPITSAELETAIADAVRKASPECEDFIGVIVHHRHSRIHHDPNWAVRGIRFGKADRKRAEEAVAAVVDKLQQEFRLADSQS
jgi:hypothetical protein